MAFLVAVLGLAACGSTSPRVEVPSNHGYPLDQALQRLHAAGLRASFPETRTACGGDLPSVGTQSPRAPAHVRRGSVVTIRFALSPVPSLGFPQQHPRFTTVPKLVGLEVRDAVKRVHALWPCIRIRAATATSATRLVVVAQDPKAGTRLPAYGVETATGSFQPTTVRLTVAAR
jgi:beta-lactam-binding protein with PASTA domain